MQNGANVMRADLLMVNNSNLIVTYKETAVVLLTLTPEVPFSPFIPDSPWGKKIMKKHRNVFFLNVSFINVRS